MTRRLADRGVRGVLLDIEGTTTPLAFVHEVLFPFARAHLSDWFASAGAEMRAQVLGELRHEHVLDQQAGAAAPAWRDDSEPVEVESAMQYALWLMDLDRKSPALKRLQGQIWEIGYRAGTLRGEIFDDVAPALRRWHAAGVLVAIFSSGSRLAQQRLFASTPQGDLTGCLTGFFDTEVGPKLDADSYRRIVRALDLPPASALFVSDVTRELVAARAAGVQVALSLRPGNRPQADAESFESIESFDQLE